MKPIPYGRQNITQTDIDAVDQVLKADFLTQGPEIEKFESSFAQYVGAKYAIAVSNGTAALHLSALVLEVQAGQKVITTPITFAASANCVQFCGGEVEFVDIDPKNYCLDVNKVRELLESQPKGTYSGIIPVDFAGYAVNIEEFKQLANEYGLWIIEDACHAPGGYFLDSESKKQFCGNGKYADLSIFSFHPVKHIACGEGGMITTNNLELYNRLKMLRTHGITKDPEILEKNDGNWYYEMHELGYNYRLTDIQAALGFSQLKQANEGLSQRKKIADTYTKSFAGIEGIQTPFVSESICHAYHLYVIQVEDRKGLYEHLRESKIFSQVHYIPLHSMPYYKKQGWKKGDMPVAEAYYEKCLSLPMFPTLSKEELQYVIDKVIEFICRS